MKVQDLLSDAVARLGPHSETAQLDAQVLLAHLAGKNRAWIAAHPDFEMEAGRVEPALKRLEAGEPLPYVVGKWEFYGLEFDLSPATLIPRPETEVLVEKALRWLKENPGRNRIADIGTGSGAIAVSIAKAVREVQILATDLSASALQTARQNAEKHGVHHQIDFVECDLLPIQDHPSRFDLICSNPPYIPTASLHTLPVYGREPSLALDGGPDGLSITRRFFERIPAQVAPQGLILLEIESTLGEAVTRLAERSFPKASIHLQRDLAGRDRVIQIKL